MLNSFEDEFIGFVSSFFFHFFLAFFCFVTIVTSQPVGSLYMPQSYIPPFTRFLFFYTF